MRTRIVTHDVTPSLNVYYKNTRIKQYRKENRALRTETTINNTYDFGIGKRLLPIACGAAAPARARPRRRSAGGGWIVPNLGWQHLFYVGGIPALFALFMMRNLPESPRWLASRGRAGDAASAIAFIERQVVVATGKPLPEPHPAAAAAAMPRLSWRDLFDGGYLRRTLVIWVAWFAAYFANYDHRQRRPRRWPSWCWDWWCLPRASSSRCSQSKPRAGSWRRFRLEAPRQTHKASAVGGGGGLRLPDSPVADHRSAALDAANMIA